MACKYTYKGITYESKEDFVNKVINSKILKKADVILPIGTSGSGKSTFIKTLSQENLVVISPDEMRVEFTGNMNDKSKDNEIYTEAANRAVKAIKQGKQVVFDTTNLTKDKRLPFIEAIKEAVPTANIQYKLMELNPELAKQRIKADVEKGANRANVPDSTIDRHAESYKQMLQDIKSEDINPYFEKQDNTKTRRILEIQSDLFQKGRDREDLITSNKVNADVLPGMVGNAKIEEYLQGYEVTLRYYSPEEKYTEQDIQKLLNDKKKELESKFEPVQSKENQFLQLLNKDNNWVTFFVKSIIQDSAKKGYKKVLFPLGDTAVKIEGHETVEGFIKNKQSRVDGLVSQWHVINKTGTSIMNSSDKEDAIKYSKNNKDYEVVSGKDYQKTEIQQLEKEIEDAKAGKLKISSIAKFYETTIKNVLYKQGYAPNKIKDEYGNEWYEVGLKKEFANIIHLQEQNKEIIKDPGLRVKHFSKSSTVSSKKVLESIAESSHPLRTLAEKLLAYSDTFNVPITLVSEPFDENLIPGNPSAYYDTGSKQIFVYEFANFKGTSSEPTLIHEILHAYTAEYINNSNSPALEDLRKAYDYITSKNSKIKDKYPLNNIDEFLVGFFTNAQFIKDLQKLPATNQFNTYKNLWEEILDYLANLFNFSQNDKNLYQELFPLLTNVIDEAAKTDYYEVHDSIVDEFPNFEEVSDYENLDSFLFDAQAINEKQDEVFASVIPDIENNSKITLTGFKREILPNEFRRVAEGKLKRSEINNVTLNKVFKRLQKVFPEINIEFVNQYELDQNDHKVPLHEIKSFIKGNTAYIVKDAHSTEDKIEEFLHPFVLGLYNKNPGLFEKIYNDSVSSYLEENKYYSKIDPEVAKKEIVTKAIKDTLINQSPKSWLQEIIQFLKDTLNSLFPRSKGDNLINEKTSLEDLGKLLLKGGYKFSTHFTNDPYYSAGPSRAATWRDKLKNFSKDVNLIKDSSLDENNKQKGYFYNGKRLMRITSIIEKANLERFKNYPLTDQQRALSQLAREDGTDFHAIIDDVINRSVDPETRFLKETISPDKNLFGMSEEIYNLIENSILERLSTYEPGTIFLSEVVLANLEKNVRLSEDEVLQGYSKKGLASTLDFIAITPDDKFHVLDWKFVSPSDKALPSGKRSDYETQLTEYVNTIRNITGARKEDFEKVQIIPFVVKRDIDGDITGLLTPSLDMSKIENKRQIPYVSMTQNIDFGSLKDMIASLNKLPIIEAERIRQLEDGKGLREDYALIDKISNAVTNILLADKNFDGDFENLLAIHEDAYLDAEETMNFLNQAANEPIDDSNKKKIFEKLDNTFQLISAIKSLKVAAQFVYGENYEKEINGTPEENQLKAKIREFTDKISNLQANFDKLNNKMIESFGEHNQVYGMNVIERKVRGFEKNFVYMDRAETRSVSLFSKVINNLFPKLDKIINANYLTLNSLKHNFQKLSSSKGLSLKKSLEGLIEFGKDGKSNPKLKAKISSGFWEAKNEILKKDINTIREFYSKYYNLDKFDTWAEEVLNRKTSEINQMKGSDGWKNTQIEKQKSKYDTSRASAFEHNKKSLDYFYLNENEEFQKDFYTDFGKDLMKIENLPMKEFYDHMISVNKKVFQHGLVPNEGFNLRNIPNIDKGFIERFREGDLTPKNLKRTWFDQLRVNPNSGLYGYVDPATQLQEKKVFVPYLEDYFNGDYSRKSLDLFEVFGTFERGLEKAIAMKEISPFVDSLVRTEKSKKVLEISSFGKIKKALGKQGEDLQPVLSDANSKYLEQHVDALVYGKTIQDGLDHAWTTKSGNTYSLGKLIQSSMSLMYQTTFGLNIFTPLRQYFEGIVSAGFLKGRDFTGRELIDFTSFFKNVTNPDGIKDKETSVFSSLMGYFLPYNNQQFNKKSDELSFNKYKSLTTPENLMYFMETSDRRNQIHIIYALLKNTIVLNGELQNSKRYVTSLPEYQNYYEDIKTDGKVDSVKQKLLDKEIEQKIDKLNAELGILNKTKVDKNGKPVIEGLDPDKEDSSIAWFKNLSQFYAAKTTGMSNEYNHVGYKVALAGRLMGMYRSWIIPTATARFGTYKFNNKANDYEWGRWLSYFNFVSQTWKESKIKTMSALLGFGRKDALIKYAKEKYGSVLNDLNNNKKIFTKDFLTEKEFVDRYLQDVKNSVNEFRFISGLFAILALGFLAPGDDDDEVTKNIKSFALFQMNRSLSGFTFYMNPTSFTDIVNNAIPATSYLQNVWKIPFFELPKETLGQAFGNEEWTKSAHPLKYFLRAAPVFSEILKYIPLVDPEAAKDLGIKPLSPKSFY